MIAGALERRVWVRTAGEPLFPNLYTFLVAPPGVGKYMVQIVRNLWFEAKKFKVAPNSVTKASLIDALRESLTVITTKTEFIEYHSLLVTSEELGVLLPAYDQDFLSVLNYLYNNPPYHDEKRRSVNKGESIIITNPQLNILAGTQPGYLSELLPESAWSTGTTARLIMVYSGTPIKVELFPEEALVTRRTETRASVIRNVAGLHAMRGEFTLDDDARFLINDWYRKGMPPVPNHSKLIYYNSRRILHIFKLCQVASASRGTDMRITAEDLDRAQGWLLEVELAMPNIFRSMTQRSDYELMQELHREAWKIYAKDQKPVPKEKLVLFLSARATADKVAKILEVCEQTRMIERNAGSDLYIPHRVNSSGLE